MINVFISYDLDRPGQSYAAIEKAVTELGVASKLLTTLWYVRTKYTRQQCLDHVVRAADANDDVLVIESSNAQGRGIPDAAWKVVTDNWNKG